MKAVWPSQILLKCVNSKKDAKKQACGFKKEKIYFTLLTRKQQKKILI
jgi:hypothetical protein